MAEKSLDDQLKEIQIAREQAELEKVKEETALVRKQVNAKWYSGRSLGQITAVALTVVALYSAVDQLFLKDIKQKEARLAKVEAALFQAQVDSLNRKKTSTITTIDSLVLSSEKFPFLDNPAVLDSAMKQYRMIKKAGYYDKRLNPDGKGIKNKYEKKVVEGDGVIYDAATDLTWQGGNEFLDKTWKDAKAYVATLNTSNYAGYKDWRLPTLKEAMSLMSLMEPKKVSKRRNRNDSLYVDAYFKETPYIWTADEYDWTDKGDALTVWGVDFYNGYCYNGHVYYDVSYVRAVR